MHLIRAATIVTPDPDAAAALYGRWLDYVVVERGEVADALAASWGAPGATGRRYAVCRPASGREVYLRFIQGEARDDYRPLRTYGWAAIELCVKDVHAVDARLQASPFEIIGPPAPLDGMPNIVAMQVEGPDREVAFLTEIQSPSFPDFDLPQAESLIDQLFILVLACSDLEAANLWLEGALKLRAGPTISLAYGVLSDAFGLPPDHKHTIATLSHGRDVFLEVDQYPPNAAPRARRDGDLPPGIAMATFHHPDFDALQGPWITAPHRPPGAIYGGGRCATMRGPDGALIEVVERLGKVPESEG
jgi:catechol 2,3-dioxygenase-like lactoylglutathione lyase family enzyme